VSPIRVHGQIVGVSKIARDISEQKQNQHVQTLLLRELNHRTKNLLAVADAIVRQTSRTSSPEELVDRISRRLRKPYTLESLRALLISATSARDGAITT
jgi:two-component sensor histidine kinase